jgi:hypothetical protein
MSKKPFDHIENKIREAAENSEPAFEEQAWDKMEAKLNADKERRRGPFMWVSLAVASFCLLGGIILYQNHYTQKLTATGNSSVTVSTARNEQQSASIIDNTIDNKNESETENINKQNSQLTAKENQVGTKEQSSLINDNIPVGTSEKQKINSAVKNKVNRNRISDNDITNDRVGSDLSNKKDNTATVNIANKKGKSKIFDSKISTRKNSKTYSDVNIRTYSSSQNNKRNIRGKTNAAIKGAEQVDEKPVDSSIEMNETVANNTDNKRSLLAIDKDKKKDSIQKTVTKKNTTAINSSKKEEIKKDPVPKKNPWYILASIGADASNVALFSFNNSSVTPRFGIGIGYQINKRISVQTGFYAGRKKYIAGAGDYNDAKDPYLSTVNINKVDANCLIFEIPIAVRYNFILRPKTTYYATAGLSSFIMKKEDYEYYYSANNNNYQLSHSYTGNKNLFSIATISVGIERKLSKAFSIQAEPSINIPIAGVGEGTVKLYSTDIQLGVKYNFHW